MGILEMDYERILGVTFFISSFHSIMLCIGVLSGLGACAVPVAPLSKYFSQIDINHLIQQPSQAN